MLYHVCCKYFYCYSVILKYHVLNCDPAQENMLLFLFAYWLNINMTIGHYD